MVIDAGSAITLDVIDHDGAYLGGAIAPGIQMCFRALAEQTALIPLLAPMEGEPPLIGRSSEEALSAGILRGVADVWAPFALNFVAFWALSLPFGWWLTFRQDAGPRGLWWGLVAGLSVAAVLLTARVVRRLAGEIRRTTVE